LTNGVIFKGLSLKKDPLTGEGELQLTNGSLYKGQIQKGQPHGQGEMIWAPEENSIPWSPDQPWNQNTDQMMQE